MTKVFFETSGDGYWSDRKAEVCITDMRIDYCDDDKQFGELRVYFDTEDWDVKHHGLIYTDRQFIDNLRTFLFEHNLPGDDVDYSEQGMQGNKYVSLDVGKKFIRSWEAKFGELTV